MYHLSLGDLTGQEYLYILQINIREPIRSRRSRQSKTSKGLLFLGNQTHLALSCGSDGVGWLLKAHKVLQEVRKRAGVAYFEFPRIEIEGHTLLITTDHRRKKEFKLRAAAEDGERIYKELTLRYPRGL